MTNPINGTGRNRGEILNEQSNRTARTDKTSAVQGDNPKPADTASNAETVSITSEASRIRELQNSLADVPDIDMEKVEAIKKEIANGNYPIDHERIASNLIDLEKSLS